MFSRERLNQEFLEFRQHLSTTEHHYLETALQAFDYLQIPYQHLVSRFNDFNSLDYIALNQQGVRDISLPLMLKLMLDIYTNDCADVGEKTLLSEISHILSQLYINPLSNLNNQTINQLSSKILQWLNHYTPNALSEDADKQKLCQAIFLSITCLRFKLQSLNWTEQTFFSINSDTLTKLSNILITINDKNPNPSLYDESQIPSSYAYFQQFQSLNENTADALIQISDICSSFGNKLDLIIKTKSELEDIKKLLSTIQANQILARPKYFHELMQQHSALFDSLYVHLPAPKKDELQDYCQKTQENSYSNYAKKSASSIFSWSNAIYRNVAPQRVQDTLNYYLETNDSKAKSLLKQHCEQAIKSIQSKLNEDGFQEFSQLDASEIEQLRSINQTTAELSNKYQRIYQHAQQWKQTSLDISGYIQHKDSFFEHVMDFIKRFVTLFSEPSLATKINLLRSQQREINGLLQSFEKEMKDHSVLSTLQPTEIATAHKTSYHYLQSQVNLFKQSALYLEYQPNNYSRS